MLAGLGSNKPRRPSASFVKGFMPHSVVQRPATGLRAVNV